MPTVSGLILNETGGPAMGATVRAIDKDLRHEQILGEVLITETSGRYVITYTADQFRRAEKKTADLIVRAFDVDGNLRAASEIRFNAGDEEAIDLTFAPIATVERPRLSELEELQEAIEPIREGIAYANFTDADLTHLTEEVVRVGTSIVTDRRATRQHLEFLRLADQFREQTTLPLAAFYGWFRQSQPRVLDELLDQPSETLRSALETAIDDRIIPNIRREIPGIIERLRDLRLEAGRVVQHRFVVQLLNAANDRPLAGRRVTVVDTAAAAGEQDLGTIFTDGRGVCGIVFPLSRTATSIGTNRLQLTIWDNGTTLAEIRVTPQINQTEVTIIRVDLLPDEHGNVRLADATSASPQLLARLNQQGITTINELLVQPELTDDDDPDALDQLRAEAKLAVLAPDLSQTERANLLNNGFRSLLEVGATSRAEFVRNQHELLGGDAATYATHFGAKEARKVFFHMIGSAWLKNVTTPGDEPPDPDIPTGVDDILTEFQSCGCKDCTSAVSPAAYLAHLLEWTLDHIKDVNTAIEFSQLEDELHQPFGDMPASCRAVEEEVRQVRICVEALWRFTDLLDREDLQLSTPFRNAYRQLRNQLYQGILTNLGTSFEQLRRALLQVEGDSLVAEQIALHRQAMADLLGIDPSRLIQLFFNIEQPPISPSEDDLQDRFGYRSTRAANVFSTTSTPPDLILWQRERLETVWQTQDWSLDSYSGSERRPFVDPALIDETYLRAPLESNPALALLQARSSALETHRQSLVDQEPQDNGLASLLETELESTIDELRTLFATLHSHSASSAEVVEAQTTIAGLNLTPAGFNHLMEIDAHQQAGEAIGLTPEAIDEAWSAAFDILSRAHRHGLFAGWVGQENAVDLIFGSALFWLPVEPSSPASLWTATTAERAEWRTALARRSERPIVDPDQIPASHIILLAMFNPQKTKLPFGLIKTPIAPPLQAMTLWQERRNWIDERLDAIRDARQDQGNSLATLEAALEASTLGLNLDLFQILVAIESEGRHIQPHLDQLNLTIPEYRFLASIRELALGGGTVRSNLWPEVDAILVQGEKRREFAGWRLAEQDAEITLHPHRFVVPQESATQDDAPQLRWLRDPLAYEQWTNTLTARGGQFNALTEGLAGAVGKAEESVLPLLRNILIMESVAPGDTLGEKAEWLDRRLLLDMQLSGCQMTTRVSQAIETLQRFIRGVYDRSHLESMDNVTLDAIEDYELEWPVIGSYATWRAFMLAYLYPENLLHVTPPLRQSHGYLALSRKLRNPIIPEQACEYSKEYSEYFRDVCSLDIQATCQVEMVQTTPGACKPASTNLIQVTHLFARSRESGKVYWAQVESKATGRDTMTTWTPLGVVGEVDAILGATPHEAGSKRYILLFAATEKSLLLRKYDLDDARWLGVKNLSWPPGFEAGIKSGAVIQKRQISLNAALNSQFPFPTLVAVTLKQGVSYIRKLRADGEGWDGNEWLPLYGPSLADTVDGIKALIQISSFSYLIVAEADAKVRYRKANADLLNPLTDDDFEWKVIGNGSYRGAFISPGDFDLFCFFGNNNGTKYRAIELNLNEPEEDDSEYVFSDIAEFNENWFIPNLGLSLDDTSLYRFERYAPDFFVPAHEPDPPGQPLHPAGWHPLQRTINGVDIPIATGDWNGDVYYSGSLLGLITRPLDDFEDKFFFEPPDNAEFYDDTPDDKYFYLFQQKYYGVQQFLEHIKNVDSVSYFHPTLGWWKWANDRIKELSEDNLTLAAVIEQLLVNQLHAEKQSWAPLGSSDRSLTFLQRSADDLNGIVEISNDEWIVPPHSGLEGTNATGTRRLTIMQMTDDDHSFPVRVPTEVRHNPPSIEATAKYELAPYGSGPFDNLPERSSVALQQRAEEIKTIYELLKPAPSSTRSYLLEAYLLVPTQLALRLQRSGFFAEALVWYRLVYDYLAPEGDQKICFGLVEEQQLTLDYDLAEDFLTDASNAHVIAATRKNTYTRHVLLLIIRCLIDYADALFARDTATDNAQARELYRQSLKLLEKLRPANSQCENILGELEIEVSESGGQFPITQLFFFLGQFGDPDQLRGVAESLIAINENTALPPIERLGAMRETVVAAFEQIPAAPAFAEVISTKRQTIQSLENQVSAHPSSVSLLRSTQEGRRESALNRVTAITSTSTQPDSLEVPWLREARFVKNGNNQPELPLTKSGNSNRLSTLMQMRRNSPLLTLTGNLSDSVSVGNGISFDFCIPQNPVVTALRTRAANNLTKLRTCRNIAGFLRQVDLYGAPIGLGSAMVSANGTVFNGIVDAAPTPYRYATVIARAKELAGIAQQIEAGYQNALESAEREALSVLQAEQNVELAEARVTLQDLRVVQSNSELGMAQLQKSSAVFRESTYAGWISDGKSFNEIRMLNAYSLAAEAQKQAARSRAAASIAQTSADMMGSFAGGQLLTGMMKTLALSTSMAAQMAGVGFEVEAINAEAKATAASFEASFERRNDEWELQQGLAALDSQIGDQQIVLAQNQINIVQQERLIAGLEHTHALDVLNFLLTKTFNEEMYRWIASVLEDVYRYFLQEATAVARLAERQLAFERQQAPLKVVQLDYWSLPADPAAGGGADRLGLTGSARLLKDIFQLDNYAFETRQRKQVLSITLDLAEMFPLEFQHFRETGVLIFNTSLSQIEREFPGYYLSLIQQVHVSVVALIPPTRGIRATCTSAGISRTVVKGDTFQEVTIRNLPERIALTSASTSSGVMELEPDSQTLLNPFEGSGFDTLWELRMPKASNQFDYNSIATVLFKVDLTALHSFDYEREVIQRLDRTVSFDRAFDFRQVFADAWYDLNHPEQSATPMVVQFETRRSDFPVNLSDLSIQNIVLYLVRKDGAVFEQPIRHLHFTAEGMPGQSGGPASTVDGRVSTRSGNGTNWLPMIGQSPVGVWELAFPDGPPADTQARDRFADEEIENMLLVLTISGETAAFPI
ncbi:MAG TPA: neuraminidase-like domain-containing protein [Pyrinomonadaceae bacterium]|nr:neuraminidase-like domain-containing protein [Pyrinomonadaceae bacterium]